MSLLRRLCYSLVRRNPFNVKVRTQPFLPRPSPTLPFSVHLHTRPPPRLRNGSHNHDDDIYKASDGCAKSKVRNANRRRALVFPLSPFSLFCFSFSFVYFSPLFFSSFIVHCNGGSTDALRPPTVPRGTRLGRLRGRHLSP